MGSPSASALTGRQRLGLAVALLLLYASLLVLSGWLQDDAFVTLRTVDNLLHGRGLTWNPGERVQVFTHPLWLLLNAGGIALSGWYELTPLLLGIALSLATYYLLLFRAASSVEVGCLAGLGLLLSKAWVDYATSGLEDPLTRLLLVIFVLVDRRPWRSPATGVYRAASLAALATLCRPDALLLFVPALALHLYRWRSWRVAAMAAAGLAPLIAWAAFALLYFGSPFPNTAYAKLGLGVPRAGLVVQGLAYLLDSLIRDPATLALMAIALAAALRAPERVDRRLILGAGLYLFYVIWIGGDYMSGRFLGLPLLACVLAVIQLPLPARSPRALAAAAALALVALLARTVEPLIQKEVGIFGVGDERRTHHPYTGLIYAPGNPRWPEHSLRATGESWRARPAVETGGAIGMCGFYAGPEVYVLDLFAIADPLRARLPGIVGSVFNRPYRLGWRPGHVVRPIPDGYRESLESGDNRIVDPELAQVYEAIRKITREPLWRRDRLHAIRDLNLGAYDPKLRSFVERHPELYRSTTVGAASGGRAAD